ncbi:MAG: hypothetical protein IJX93_09755 [Clostridia bacterium]|nr:hypothetical protein [Clostridia bacterium]MBQ8334042.1 hypothetical protein [Clostridia bacterium]MBQ8370653.1 hypothetical protein [Clostridia bacterium]MBQ8512361.1 hypothetical protein [Clostridia bacterium]
MKIEIFDGGERVIRLLFPTAVLFNRLTGHIAASMIRKTLDGKAEEIDAELSDLEEIADTLPDSGIDGEKLSALFAELRRFKRTHPGFVLVDVQDEEGDGIVITL